MTIKINVRNTTRRESGLYDSETTTPRMVFEDKDLQFSAGNITVNAVPITAGQADMPISQLTDAQEVLLASVVKADGAAC